MVNLDNKYRAEGWGKITDLALGIRPSDVESQAREVARYAAARIAALEAQLAGLATENERLTKERDEAERLKINWFETHIAHREANQALGKANGELLKRAFDAERRAEAVSRTGAVKVTVDGLAQEIRRVDGSHMLGAGALAEALMPFLSALEPAEPEGSANLADDDDVDAAYKAALDSLPAEFHGEVGRGELDRMVRAIVKAHDSKWERRAKAMAHHHHSALQASIVTSKPAAPEGQQEVAREIELSGSTGELIDKMAEAIRGDTTSDETPWATLSEDRKIGWRGDAERALAVVKHYLTARRPSEQAVTEAQQEPVAWQPIETTPKDGREILTWSEIMGMAVWPSTAKWERHVTHWMPLPEPPEAAMEAGR